MRNDELSKGVVILAHHEVRAALERAVADTYKVFSGYSLGDRTRLTVCKCDVCMSDEIEAALLATSLQEIPLLHIQELENSADGGGDEFETKYFLPRHFELLKDGEETSLNGIESSLKRLGEWDWRTWPEKESEVIDRFLRSLLRASLYTKDPCYWEGSFEEYLVLLAESGVSAVFSQKL